MDIVKISLVKITSQLKAGEITLGLANTIKKLIQKSCSNSCSTVHFSTATLANHRFYQ